MHSNSIAVIPQHCAGRLFSQATPLETSSSAY
jgi:hypothetical protein